jgi:hypothetical protein
MNDTHVPVDDRLGDQMIIMYGMRVVWSIVVAYFVTHQMLNAETDLVCAPLVTKE